MPALAAYPGPEPHPSSCCRHPFCSKGASAAPTRRGAGERASARGTEMRICLVQAELAAARAARTP